MLPFCVLNRRYATKKTSFGLTGKVTIENFLILSESCFLLENSKIIYNSYRGSVEDKSDLNFNGAH